MPCCQMGGTDSSGPFSPLRRGAERLWLGRTPTLLAWPKRCILVSMVFVGFSLVAGIRRSFVEAAYSLQREANWKMFNNDTSSGNWTTDFIRSFQSSFTWGLFIGHVIGSALSYKYHANSVFAAAILLDSSLHLVVAGVMQVHQIFLVSLLFLQGVADGLTFPAFFSLLRYWAPPLERTRMFTAGYAGLHLGSLLSFQIFSVFESLFSSTAGLYFYGMLGILWVLPWFLLVSETPSKHPGVSTREKIYIIDSLQTQEHIPFSQQPTGVPMRSILSSGPVWAILLASFGRTWTYNTLLHIMQWYYNDEIRYAKEIPYFLMMVSVVVSGYVADGLQEKNLMTTSTVRKTFGATGLLTEAVLFLSMVYVGPTDFAMVLYFFAMSIRELAVAGYMVNPLDISPQYAGIIAGLSGAMTSLGNLTFYPMMNHIFNTWKIRHDHMTPLYAVSVISGGLQFLAALIFVVFSSATEQDWSKDDAASPSASGDALYGTSSGGGNNNNDPYLDTTEVIVSDGGISLNVIVKR
ncbi:vesicular glutamate transporter 2.1 [Dermacentor silvarum]|uniref:vesicular glutamate transporter 2.1 n=1 Tax=Dermacentor silvarum TaxID=543639 RepID=UPI00189C4159|nr:vesicular glutamate transporter 2.1 [Dermacentor silvarum]